MACIVRLNQPLDPSDVHTVTYRSPYTNQGFNQQSLLNTPLRCTSGGEALYLSALQLSCSETCRTSHISTVQLVQQVGYKNLHRESVNDYLHQCCLVVSREWTRTQGGMRYKLNKTKTKTKKDMNSNRGWTGKALLLIQVSLFGLKWNPPTCAAFRVIFAYGIRPE